MLDQVGRVSRKEASAGDATRSLLETIGGDPDRWLRTEPAGAPVRPLGMMGEGIGWVFWITATGRKDGRVGRYTCWLVDLWGGLALAALRILRGEVSVRGVVPPEGCFDPLPFFEGLRQYRAEKDRDKPLIGETMEWLS